ncbi:phage upper tail fiber protein [Nocardia puris]|uniref:Minor tail protein gp31 C-terminal domain-containing protein n=1 Tax=Nocardia puris TaxID=208602 RepID=A0A366CWM2_9NOCA|nr:hypothetical protein [Nocardia puris]RBO82056.1 hypothetical protein DFR74_12511 [Nocardia puris]
MTVISDSIESIGGADDTTSISIASPVLRAGHEGGVITRRPLELRAVDGVLTTPDLDPGPATVRIGVRTYLIDIPDSGTPVELWPLIEAGLPVPPEEEATAVRNGGGVARIQRLTQSAYESLATPDPETLYVVIED